MTIALVSHVSVPNYSTTSSAIDTTGASLLVAAISGYGTLAISDSYGNTWTKLNTISTAYTYDGTIFYAASPTVGTGHTFTTSNYEGNAEISAFSGVASSSPFDQQTAGYAGTASSTVQPGSITPTADGALVITETVWYDNTAGVAATIGGGFTITDQNGPTGTSPVINSASAYLIQTTAAAANPAWDTGTATQVSGATIASFLASGGGGGGGSGDWNAGTVTALGGGLSLSSGTISADWHAGTVAALGSGITLASGTLSASASEWTAGTVSALGSGLAISSGTISATGGGSSEWTAGTVSALGAHLSITSGTIAADVEWTAGTVSSLGSGLSLSGGTLTASGGGGGGGTVSARTVTASTTAVIGDAGNIVELNAASNVTFTVPTNATVDFDLQTEITVVQLGAGVVEVVAGGSPVAFLTSSGVLATAGQYSQLVIRQRDTDTWIPSGDFNTFVSAATYFVIAPDGSDDNPGTLAAPFATANAAKLAMQATSGGTTTTYFRTGVYVGENVSAPYLQLHSADNGTTWAGWPGDAPRSAVLQYGPTPSWVMFDLEVCENITLTNLTFDGGAQGGAGPGAGFLFGTGPGLNNITVTHCHFTNNFYGPGVTFWDLNTFTFQFNECGPNEYQPISIHNTDTISYGDYLISGNNFHNYTRMGIEIQVDTEPTAYWFNVHIDWNEFSHYYGDPGGSMYGISFVAGDQMGTGLGGNTIWGNVFTGTMGQNAIGIESGNPNTTISDNTFTDLDYPFSISGPIDVAIYDNTMSGYNTTLNGAPYHEDGGYNLSEWIGDNTLAGSVVAGWPGSGNTYGTEPATYSPSTEVTPV